MFNFDKDIKFRRSFKTNSLELWELAKWPNIDEIYDEKEKKNEIKRSASSVYIH